jgi:hypothetical protein
LERGRLASLGGGDEDMGGREKAWLGHPSLPAAGPADTSNGGRAL